MARQPHGENLVGGSFNLQALDHGGRRSDHTRATTDMLPKIFDDGISGHHPARPTQQELLDRNTWLASKIAEPFDAAQGERNKENPFVVRLSNHEG
jgi:hypothetical protein